MSHMSHWTTPPPILDATKAIFYDDLSIMTKEQFDALANRRINIRCHRSVLPSEAGRRTAHNRTRDADLLTHRKDLLP